MTTPSRFCPLILAVLLAGNGAARAADDAAGHGAPRDANAYLPLAQTLIPPLEFTPLAPGHVFVDFGRAAFAGLRLHVAQADEGRTVTVHLGEKLSAPRTVDRKPGGSVRYHQAAVTLKAGQDTYLVPLTAADARLMPPQIGPVMPFRYVEIENAPASLKADQV